jgi:hypothetical protein
LGKSNDDFAKQRPQQLGKDQPDLRRKAGAQQHRGEEPHPNEGTGGILRELAETKRTLD